MGIAMKKVEKVKNWSSVKLYDQFSGKFIRNIKSNYITHHAIASTSVVAAGGTTGQLACGTTDAYHEAYVTAYGFSGSTTGAEMFFLAGTTGDLSATVLPAYITAYTTYSEFEDIDAPFYKLGPTSSICLHASATGTYCGWITLIHHPIFRYAEPTSTIST